MGKSVNSTLLQAYELMCISKEMTDCFEKNKEITQTYVCVISLFFSKQSVISFEIHINS